MTLQGVHIGETKDEKYRTAQKIDFARIKSDIDAFKKEIEEEEIEGNC